MNGDTIEVRQGTITCAVEVAELGERFYILGQHDDSEKALKCKIRDKCGLNPLVQLLYRGDRQIRMDRGDKIRPDDLLSVKTGPCRILIDAVDIGGRFEISIGYPGSFHDIKLRVNNRCGVPLHEQYLEYQRRLLRESTFKDDLPDGATVVLRRGPLPVVIRMPNGTTLALDCHPEDDSNDIKTKVHARTGIPVKEQSLAPPNGIGVNRWLGQTLAMQGIGPGSSLRLSFGTIPIHFIPGAGRPPVQVTVPTTRTVSRLMSTLQELKSIRLRGFRTGGIEPLPH